MSLLPRLFIIDGNSFTHRAFHAIPALSTKDGFPTNAITGFCNMICNIQKNFAPDRMVITFDAKGTNFRHDIYEYYKANRPETDPMLKMQREPINQIVDAWGIPTLCVSGVEADDSMSALGLVAAKAGYEVVLVTSDKDMSQMVSDELNITILDTKDAESASKAKPLDEAGVLKKYGVPPSKIVDLLALMGDSVDNIPGVAGCGEKTAIKWIKEFGSVQGVIDNADQVKGAAGKKLIASLDNLKMSHELVTIKTDIDLGKPLDEFVGQMDEDKLYELITKYELKQLKKNLGIQNKNAESTQLELNTDIVELIELMTQSDLNNKTVIINEFQAEKVRGFMVTFEGSTQSYFIDLTLMDTYNAEFVRQFIDSESVVICSLDAKQVLKTFYEITNDERVFTIATNDVFVFDFVMNGGKKKTSPIEYLNDEYCDFNLSPLRVEFKLNGKTPQWKKMTLQQIIEVKSEELYLTRKVHSHRHLCKDESTLSTEDKLTPILAHMESTGAYLSRELLTELGKTVQTRIESLETDIFGIAGQEFNINSPKQVGAILFDTLAIPTKKRSTSEDVLKALADENPIINMIFEHRSQTKLKGTYIERLLNIMDSTDRVHTVYNQDITITGRLSSDLQNIPVRNEDGRQIRKAFIAGPGRKIVALDYSQIELRILAHRAQVSRFIEAFKNGEDIHAITAMDLFNVPLEEVTDEQRRRAKAINFGLIYGLGSGALSEELGCTKQEAKAFSAEYFEKYPEIEPYFNVELEFAKENQFVLSSNGRKIPTKDLNSANVHARSHAERSTKNVGIQGTASDIIKEAMIKAGDYLIMESERLNAKMFMQVHDELVFEVDEEHAQELASSIQSIMMNAVQLTVPLVVNYKIADNWLEAH